MTAMKVKHALLLGTLSLGVFGGGVITYAVGDTRADWVTSLYVLKEHGYGDNYVSKTEGVDGVRSYVYETKDGVTYTIDTKLTAIPEIVSDNYKSNVAQHEVLVFTQQVEDKLSALDFKVDEGSIKTGVADDKKTYVTLELETKRDMSIFGLTDDDYDAIHESLSILSPLTKVQGYTLAVNFDDNNDGRVQFVAIDKYTTPDMVKTAVYESVQSQIGSDSSTEAKK